MDSEPTPDREPPPGEVQAAEADVVAMEAVPDADASSAGSTVNREPSASENLSTMIADLKQEKIDLKDRRKRVLMNLRNAKRRHARLKTKTKQLSENDLMEALRLRRLPQTPAE